MPTIATKVPSDLAKQIRRAAEVRKITVSAFRVVPVVSLSGVARYVARYQVDFADACLVALSENFPAATVVTTDNRDFSFLRRFGKERIPFIGPGCCRRMSPSSFR